MSNRQMIRQVALALLATAGAMLLILVLVLAIVAVTLFTGLPELKLHQPRQPKPTTTLLPTRAQALTPSPTRPNLKEGELLLKTGEQSAWQFDAPGAGRPVRLALEARLDFEKLAGATPCLEVLVNGEPVMGPRLSNKALDFDFADGRAFAYFHPSTGQQPYNLWMVFYSPDFSGNAQPGSGYQVLSGEPYRYEFDITPLVRPRQTNTMSVTNHSEPAAEKLGRPLWLVIRHMTVWPQAEGDQH